jgi:hypothetical protein
VTAGIKGGRAASAILVTATVPASREQFANLAAYPATVRYPAQTWQPQLGGYENAQLKEVRQSAGQLLAARLDTRKRTFMKQLTTSLDGYRRSHLTVGKVRSEGKCHIMMKSGEIGILIDTDPRGGAVQFL